MAESFSFIHTSDWHLGLSLYDRDCFDRQKAMLAQIAGIVAERKPDALLLSGDIYNSSQPPVWADRLLVEGMADIRRAGGPEMRIIAMAGNHDSGMRHEALRGLWNFAGIDMAGCISRAAAGQDDAALAVANSRLIVEIPGKAFVLAVPYTHGRNMPDGFYQIMLDAVAARNTAGLPVVMMAHCTVGDEAYFRKVADCAAPEAVGGIDVSSFADLGSGYDYLALGHIHRPATFSIPGLPALAHYCGTPLAVSFDERFRHTVSHVTVEGHGPQARIKIEKIPVRDCCPLVNIPPDGFAPWNECLEELKAYPAASPALIRVNVLVSDYLHPEAREEAIAALEGKAASLCIINSGRRAAEECGGGSGVSFTVSEFQEVEPFDLALRYAGDTGADFGPALQQAFKEIVSATE